MTDDLLKRFLVGSLTRVGLKRAVDRAFGRLSPDLAQGKTLSPDALDFVHDVIEHQDDSVRARYKRLGLSVDKGNQLKRELVENGILEEDEVRVARTHTLLLRVTPAARVKLGLRKLLGRGSIAHEYWKRFYATRLREDGYEVMLEAARKRGAADVLTRKGGETIAIEIESGKSNAVWNVKQDLLSGFGRVIIVATDEAAFGKVEQQLGRAGLIIPRRVRVVLRDDYLEAA